MGSVNNEIIQEAASLAVVKQQEEKKRLLELFKTKIKLHLDKSNEEEADELARFNEAEQDALADFIQHHFESLGLTRGQVMGMFNEGFNIQDFLLTLVRIPEVMRNVSLNGSNDDSETDNSLDRQLISVEALSQALAVSSILSFGIGVVLNWRRLRLHESRLRVSHILKQLDRLPFNDDNQITTEADYIKFANQLMQRGKLIPLPRLPQVKVEKSRPRKIAEKLLKIGDSIWSALNKTAQVYWPTWMIASMVVGITAVGFPPVLPIVVGVTLGVSVALHGGRYLISRYKKYKAKLRNKGKTKEEIEREEAERQAHLEDTKYMRLTAAQRAHAKMEFGIFKRVFAEYVPAKIAKPSLPAAEPRYLVGSTVKKPRAVFIKNPRHQEAKQDEANDNVGFDDTTEEAKAAKQSKLGRYLIGTRHQQRLTLALNFINEMVGQYTAAAFVLWLVSSVLSVFAPLASVALIIGSGIMTAAFGGAFGAINGGRHMIKVKGEQKEFQKYVAMRLSETYVTTNPKYLKPNGEQQTKHEVFAQLEKSVDDKKAGLAARLKLEQKALRLLKKQGKPLSEDQEYILNLRLKDMNVYNHRYYRTQEPRPSRWTRFKKSCLWLYRGAATGQTWIFVARSLFLAGAVAAGFCLLFGPGAGFAFVAVALTLATIGITLKIMQLYRAQKQEEKKQFAETLDERISTLKKYDKKLDILNNYFAGNKVSVALNDTPAAPSPPPPSLGSNAQVLVNGASNSTEMPALKLNGDDESDDEKATEMDTLLGAGDRDVLQTAVVSKGVHPMFAKHPAQARMQAQQRRDVSSHRNHQPGVRVRAQ